MRLSGVDPGIIRELSGIYKPFTKAFKELISNAYDADASRIDVAIAPGYDSITVEDDGAGMTPYQFRDDFTRLGGSTARLRGGRSPKGRERIGYKGIGFLAVARYCSRLEVTTTSRRAHKGSTTIDVPRGGRVPLTRIVGDTVPSKLLMQRISIKGVQLEGKGRKPALHPKRDFVVEKSHLIFKRPSRHGSQPVAVSFAVDCRNLVLRAVLDFDYLLGLENQADLRLLDDFCQVDFEELAGKPRHFTRIELAGLKDFVAKKLSAPALKGKARNIASKSGRQQFTWSLSRCSPIATSFPDPLPPSAVLERMKALESKAELPELWLRWGDDPPAQLFRPLYLPRSKEHLERLDETIIPVDVSEDGLRVVGYLMPRMEVIYPAELRGISVRVRNVSIGDAGFFGWDARLSGARKAALAQVAGELIVLSGLNAADAINPGRESFYEENAHYRILQRVLFGSEESIGGLAKTAVGSILSRIHLRSQVTGRLAVAKQRRKTLGDISSAVNHYARQSEWGGKELKRFFSKRLRADGLATSRNVPLRPGYTISGFEVEQIEGLTSDFEIDFRERKVHLDFKQDVWSTSVYLNGHYYDVQLKFGKPDHPICEFDNQNRRIYVNWSHPAKQHMDEDSFLRAAIALRLAHHAAPSDANLMMDLALRMLSFRAE